MGGKRTSELQSAHCLFTLVSYSSFFPRSSKAVSHSPTVLKMVSTFSFHALWKMFANGR